jgi:acyl-CoA thioester hydrolase
MMIEPTTRGSLSGDVEGFRFAADVHARFNETDAQGIVHHAVHLIWFEVARIAYLARVEGGYRGLVASCVDVTTTEAHVRYRAPVRFDDRLRVWTRAVDVGRTRFRFEYAVERADDRTLLADGWTSHACVDATTLRPTRMPGGLAAKLAELEGA